MLQHADPKDVDWAAHGVNVVVQATRKHRTVAECQNHLDNGADYVILATVPDDPTAIETLVMGVNDEVLDSGDRIISLGSNTSNALAPVLKILDDEFGIDAAMFTTVHALTNEQRLADVPGDTLRLSRAAAENIIPAPTNSPEIIERVLPAVKGKLAGMALNVPVADGSNVDLVAFLEKPATTRERQRRHRRRQRPTARILEYTEEPIVSSDVIGNPHSAVFDGLATVVMDGTMIKAVIWFDNGWGYAARAVELMEKLAAVREAGGVRMTRVAINGFGRIGRSVYRVISERPDAGIEIVAINDLADDEMATYLLKHDTVMGEFPGEVVLEDGHLVAGGHRARLLTIMDPADLPWEELGVDVVIESTGVFRTREAVAKHIDGRRQAGHPHRARQGRTGCHRGARRQRRRPRTRTTRSSPTPRAPPTAWRRSPRSSTTHSGSSAA